MMLGERSYSGPTVQIPSWFDDTLSPTANAGGTVDDYSQFFQADSLKALQLYLPSNSDDAVSIPDSDSLLPVDAHTCDHFRMYEFKVRKCTRGRSHDWTECPFAHPGEKARRRDPRKFHYSGTACPDFRKGAGCRRGDACEFAHGVFECWLHPARYRTQPCKDGMACRRRVCFFAHSPDQLRVLSPRATAQSDSPPPPQQQQRRLLFVSPPTPEVVSPQAESPPMSPLAANEMVASLRQLHLNNKVKSSFPATASLLGCCSSSPRGLQMNNPSGFFSLPTTPTRALARPGIGYLDTWQPERDEETMERVESGRDLRAKMFEKLSKENPLDRDNPNPDVGWVSELVNLS